MGIPSLYIHIFSYKLSAVHLFISLYHDNHVQAIRAWQREALQQAAHVMGRRVSMSRGRALQDFGQHGRELICSEIALRLLRALCEGGPSLSQLAGRAGLEAEHLERVLDSAVLQVGGQRDLALACQGLGIWRSLRQGRMHKGPLRSLVLAASVGLQLEGFAQLKRA